TPFSNTPFTKQELQQLIQSKFKALGNQANFNEIDTSYITDMSGLFAGMTTFNADISSWNISRVTDMSNMFAGASSFNQDLGQWETGSVTNMAGMFQGATSFNNGKASGNTSLAASIDRQAVGGTKKVFGDWNTSKVQDMSGMFAGAASFNQDLSKWQFTEVEKTTAMFRGATAFNAALPTLKPDTAPRLRDTSSMFEGAGAFAKDLSSWDLPPTAKRENMFSGSPLGQTDAVAKRPKVGKKAITTLAAPAQPTAPEATTSSIKVTWVKRDGATSYTLYHAATPPPASLALWGKVTLGNVGTATVTGLKPYTEYSFKVVASGPNHWDSLPSAPRTRKTKELGTLAAPKLRASEVKGKSLLLSWAAVSKATAYLLYKSESTITDISGLTPITTTAANYRFTGLTQDTKYYFRVVATTAPGYIDSPPSSELAPITHSQPADKKALIAEIKKVFTGWLQNTNNDSNQECTGKNIEGATASLNHIDTGLITNMSALF
ncbi:MAG: BspA family leucine-rich repeat surface protein, partial [Spirochaetota bacterium]